MAHFVGTTTSHDAQPRSNDWWETNDPQLPKKEGSSYILVSFLSETSTKTGLKYYVTRYQRRFVRGNQAWAAFSCHDLMLN